MINFFDGNVFDGYQYAEDDVEKENNFEERAVSVGYKHCAKYFACRTKQ